MTLPLIIKVNNIFIITGYKAQFKAFCLLNEKDFYEWQRFLQCYSGIILELYEELNISAVGCGSYDTTWKEQLVVKEAVHGGVRAWMSLTGCLEF